MLYPAIITLGMFDLTGVSLTFEIDFNLNSYNNMKGLIQSFILICLIEMNVGNMKGRLVFNLMLNS